MSIPDYETIMLPLLQFAADQKVHSFQEAIDAMAERFNLTDEERKKRYPSGKLIIFNNQVVCARAALKQGGLLEYPKPKHFRITQKGIELLKSNPTKIDHKFIRHLMKANDPDHEGNAELCDVSAYSPEELLEDAYKQLRESLAADLLSMMKQCSPEFFERLVIDVLVKMGYGGTRQDAGQAIGRTGDGGIDGVIKEDRLGLDSVYIQAKRWDGVVGRPEIQKFAGALQGRHARKGIFITTGRFSDEAHDYVKYIDSRIVLIDGETLVELMIDNDVGVNTVRSLHIKKIDHDYFEE
jgi:restriction system protein